MLRQTRTFLTALCVISLLFSVTASSFSQTAGRRRSKRTPGTPVSKARAITADEFPALLKSVDARPRLVNYWATWCDPCREEFPDLVRIDSEYRSKGLDTIAISLDDYAEIKTEVPKFLQRMKARMPVYLLNVADPEPQINLADPTWGGALPATFIYDGKGEIVFKKFGRFDTAELRAAINKVMSEK
jgi:thiol-disulfide isomerase/thioredoxin